MLRRLLADARTMTRHEMAYRVRDAASRRFGRHARLFPPGPVTDDQIRLALGGAAFAASPEDWRAHLASRSRPRFFFDPADRARFSELLRTFDPPMPRADGIRRGQPLLFGALGTAQPLDWHRDPGSGHRWPHERPWWELSLNPGRGIDVRRAWELSRHRDLFVLGRAYWATGDAEYARTAAARLDSWLRENPPELGINWASNLEIAVRSIAWIWALQFFRGAEAFDPALIWRMTGTLMAAARHISRDIAFSRACMPGNHVIGDAAGLAIIALQFPELRDAESWRAQAFHVLQEESVRQLTADGFHVEESPAYHLFVWELLYSVAALGERNGHDVSGLWDVLRRMAFAAAALVTPDRNLPASGDSDDSAAYDLRDGTSRAAAMCAVAAVRFAEPLLKTVAMRPAEDLLWLIGPDALERWSHLDVREMERAADTAPGLVARTDSTPQADYAFFRCGGMSRHTHADALHLDIVVEGTPVLVDGGPGSYNGANEWRNYFRGTAAHNTLVVDGEPQAEPHRAFRWRTPLHTRRGGFRSDDAGIWMDGEHDGYQRLGVIHRRQVLWLRDWGWIVVDRLTGSGDHDVTLQWLAATKLECHDGFWAASDERGTRLLGIAIADGDPGVTSPAAAWRSTRYGEWQPAEAVRLSRRLQTPTVLTTFLCPLRGRLAEIGVEHAVEGADVTVRTRHGAGSRAFRLSLAGWLELS